jgi:hypothetical protein
MYAELRVGNLKYSQSLAKEISPTGEGVNHIVKRGEFQIVQDVQSLRFVQNVNRKTARSTFKTDADTFHSGRSSRSTARSLKTFGSRVQWFKVQGGSATGVLTCAGFLRRRNALVFRPPAQPGERLYQRRIAFSLRSYIECLHAYGSDHDQTGCLRGRTNDSWYANYGQPSA